MQNFSFLSGWVLFLSKKTTFYELLSYQNNKGSKEGEVMTKRRDRLARFETLEDTNIEQPFKPIKCAGKGDNTRPLWRDGRAFSRYGERNIHTVPRSKLCCLRIKDCLSTAVGTTMGWFFCRILAITTAFLCAAIISFTVGNNLLLSYVRLRSFAFIFFFWLYKFCKVWGEWKVESEEGKSLGPTGGPPSPPPSLAIPLLPPLPAGPRYRR